MHHFLYFETVFSIYAGPVDTVPSPPCPARRPQEPRPCPRVRPADCFPDCTTGGPVNGRYGHGVLTWRPPVLSYYSTTCGVLVLCLRHSRGECVTDTACNQGLKPSTGLPRLSGRADPFVGTVRATPSRPREPQTICRPLTAARDPRAGRASTGAGGHSATLVGFGACRQCWLL